MECATFYIGFSLFALALDIVLRTLLISAGSLIDSDALIAVYTC